MTKSDELLTQEILSQAAAEHIAGFKRIQTQRANELVIRDVALNLYIGYMAARGYTMRIRY